MKKIFYIIAFLTLGYNSKSQVNHIVGIDGGPSIFGYVTKPGIEYNLHYLLNYKPFLFKTNIGITPNTNFGTLTQFYLTIGFTTPLEKFISVHLVYGIGKTWVGKEKFVTNDSDGNQITYSFVYLTYPGLNPIATSGFYIKPIKTNNFLIGIDVSISQLGLENHSLFTSTPAKGVNSASFFKAKYIKSKPFAFNLVISYIFKKEKK